MSQHKPLYTTITRHPILSAVILCLPFLLLCLASPFMIVTGMGKPWIAIGLILAVISLYFWSKARARSRHENRTG